MLQDGYQEWYQDRTGVLGEADYHDNFGAALVTADFDGDGYDELVIGAPGEVVDTADNAGGVNVLHGSAAGLTESGDQLLKQSNPGLLDQSEDDDAFGAALAAGDFNGDGFDDLAVNAPGEDVGGVTDAGAADVLFGTATGLLVTGSQFWHQDISGIRGEVGYVTGTGASDYISIMRQTDRVAAVTVQAFADADRQDLLASIRYSVATSDPIVVEAGGGADHIVIDARLGTTVEVRGGAEADILTVNGTTGDDQITVTRTRVTIGTTHVDYTEVEKLRVRAEAGEDTLHMLSATNHTPVDLFGGDHNDRIEFGDSDTSLGRLHSRVVVWGGEGTDEMYLSDRAATQGQAYSVTGTSVSRSGASDVSYGDIERLTLETSHLNDTITVQSTSSTTPLDVNAGSGNDTINIGSAGNSLATILEPVTVHGDGGATDVLNLNDHNSGAGLAYVIGRPVVGGSAVLRGGSTVVVYDTLERLVLNAGTAGDTFNVEKLSDSPSVTVNGRGGADTLLAPNRNNTWNVTGANSGNLTGDIAFSSVENLTGNSNADRFAFSNGATISGVIDGRGGSDTLDYTLYSTTVTARLSTGTATGSNGVRSIENVLGGAVDDVIIGNSGANTLRGGGGRDVVIGGWGADILYGDTGDDLLISSTTDYDANDLALFTILGEWSRGDRTYAERIDQLRNGGGRNGDYRLDWTTVHEDSVSDTLRGGAALDWFFVSSEDSLPDLSGLEQYERYFLAPWDSPREDVRPPLPL
jgi:hypothetical protein